MNAINQKEPPATAFSEHNAYSRGTRSGRIYGRVVRIFVAASIELLRSVVLVRFRCSLAENVAATALESRFKNF
jgi:hypothetical protein